jgi:hypothetical protein
MSELSPEARELVEDGHTVLRPSSRDRARVASALATRLGAATLVLPHQASAAAPKSLLAWPKLSTLVVGVSAGLVTIGASYFVSQSPPATASAPVKPPAVATSKAEPPPAPASVAARAEAELVRLVPESPASPPRKAPTADPLVEEVAILSRATSQLRAGRPAEGLRLLEEHQRKFPNGRLTEERRAARIQALCALGDRTAAEAELARLAHAAPRSPHLARAKRACGITP